MKKKILLFGCTDDGVGTSKDLHNYRKFFISPTGGCWHQDSEIIIKADPPKSELLELLGNLNTENLDYLIVVFSGHGEYVRQDTVVQINNRGEEIEASKLQGIAARQLNIFDCCRRKPEAKDLSESLEVKTKNFTASSSVREKFDARILQARRQQATLWSCKVGQVSWGSSEGGTYSKHLIDAANNFIGEYQLVSTAHEIARAKTMAEHSWRSEKDQQHPDYDMVKYSAPEQLIIGIKE